MPTLFRLLVVLTIVFNPGVAHADTQTDSTVRLSDYLEALNQHGESIVFSSALVPDDLLLQPPIPSRPSKDELDELLRPFGLSVRDGPAESLLIVRGELPVVTSQPVAVPILDPLPEIVVTSSLRRLEYSSAGGSIALDRELAARVPAAAEEAVRLPDRLPGVATGGISTRSHVRGGEENETLYLLDGLRLYEPFHLKDFQSVATVINSNAIAGMDFYSGAFPARFGDRMSAVMDISLREAEADFETELALSFFNASAMSLGRFGGYDKGEWLFAARRGNLDLIADIAKPDLGSPDYNDFLGHLGWVFGPRADISVNFLMSSDKINLSDDDRGEQASAEYQNLVFWSRWDAAWSDVLRSTTVVSFTDIDNERSGSVDLPDVVAGVLADHRDFRAVALKQDWVYAPSQRWMLGFGIDGKHQDGRYVFDSTRTLKEPFDQIFDNSVVDIRSSDLTIDGAQYAAYAEFRWKLHEAVVVDLGLRWDHQSYTTAESDEQSSPRISVLFLPGDRTELRLGWGQFSQAEEANELQVSDGLESFHRAQRAEHVVANMKHRLGSGLDLELSVFRKTFRSVRPRFENALNSLSMVPELQFDRVMVDADSAKSIGAEILLSSGTSADDLFWWVGYTWSEVEDSLGSERRKRSWDQTHAGKYGASWRWKHWDFSVAGVVHTGWPRTDLVLESSLDPGDTEQLTLTASDLNSLRHSVFHSLDARVSRDVNVRYGELKLFLEVTNLYNRQNDCCTEYSIGNDETGTTVLEARTEHWLPLVPSLGFVWVF